MAYKISDECIMCGACAAECPVDAISEGDDKYVVDADVCVDCGACAKVCPYNAIVNRQRPCQIACKIKAISINDDEAAQIDYSKCTSCGACRASCPVKIDPVSSCNTAECIRCGRCVRACQDQAIRFCAGSQPIGSKAEDPAHKET